jgi:hypothetical protein
MDFLSFLKYTFIIFASHLATSCGAPFENHCCRRKRLWATLLNRISITAHENLSISSARNSATIAVFAWSVRVKPENTLIRIASHRVENWTRYLPNTKQESSPPDRDFRWILRRLMELDIKKCDKWNLEVWACFVHELHGLCELSFGLLLLFPWII